MEVRPGIHQIPGLRWSNAYLLVEEERLTLVDAGLPGSGHKIFHYIRSIGRNPRELQQVLLTHGHPDHVGPLKKLSQTTGAAITVHRADTRHRQGSQEHWLHYHGQLIFLPGSLPFLHRIPAHGFIEDGQVLPVLGGLQVLHTPGHTAGSVCFYLAAQGVLLTGDTLLGDGYIFRRPVPFPGTNFRDYRASVERLAGLSFETALVGHGRPVLEGGTARLQEMLDHYGWLTPRWNRLKRWSRSLLGH